MPGYIGMPSEGGLPGISLMPGPPKPIRGTKGTMGSTKVKMPKVKAAKVRVAKPKAARVRKSKSSIALRNPNASLVPKPRRSRSRSKKVM